MTTQIELLATLQSVDQRLRSKTLEVADGEGRVAALEEAVRTQAGSAEAGREAMAGLNARQRDLEARLAAAETKMKDRRMRITRIRNDKDLGVAKREVELLKEEVTALETELMGVLEQVEAAGTKQKQIEDELARLTVARDTDAAALKEKLGRLTAEITREQSARTEIVQTVDGELRRRYEMIFSRRGGLAVVEIREGTCQGCRMRVPAQLFNEIQRNTHVILCPSCQRILYWRADAQEANE